jgi:hypothetical protein
LNDHKIRVSAYVFKNGSGPIGKTGPFSNPRDLEPFFELIPLIQDTTIWDAIVSQSHSNAKSCCCNQILDGFRRERLVGFVFRPGLDHTRLKNHQPYSQDNMSLESELRCFVKGLSEHFPSLPIQEEESLNQAKKRGHFLTKMFAHGQMKAFFDHGWSIAKLLDFHQGKRDILRVRNERLLHDIETLLSRILIYPLEQVEKQYRDLFIRASLS